jgi:hypothetical protein
MLLLQKAYVEGIRALIYHTGFYVDMGEHHPDQRRRPTTKDLRIC